MEIGGRTGGKTKSIHDRIVKLCQNNPGGMHRLVIIAKVKGAMNDDLEALVHAGRLEKTGGAPTLYVVKGEQP